MTNDPCIILGSTTHQRHGYRIRRIFLEKFGKKCEKLTRWPSRGTRIRFFMMLFFHNSEVLSTRKNTIYGHYGIRIIAMSNLDRENWLVKPNCCVVFVPSLIQHVGRFSSGDVASLVWSNVLFWFLLSMCVSLYIYIIITYLCTVSFIWLCVQKKWCVQKCQLLWNSPFISDWFRSPLNHHSISKSPRNLSNPIVEQHRITQQPSFYQLSPTISLVDGLEHVFYFPQELGCFFSSLTNSIIDSV